MDTPLPLHNSLRNVRPQRHKESLITVNLWGKGLYRPLRVYLGSKLKTYLCSNRQALSDNTPTHIPRCSLDSAMETAWKLMTQTEKDKERGKGISEMSGTPCCWHGFVGRGLFSEVLALDFPTGALTIQYSVGAAAFLESPRLGCHLKPSWELECLLMSLSLTFGSMPWADVKHWC